MKTLNRRQKRALDKKNKTSLPYSVSTRKLKRIEEEQCYVGSEPIRTQIELEGFPFQAILDSGSTLNIINEDIWKQLNRQCPQLHLQPDLTIIEGLAGKANNMGKVKLNIAIGSMQKNLDFLIVRHTRVLVLLGVPALKAFELILDFKNELLNIPNASYSQKFTSLNRLDEQLPLSTLPMNISLSIERLKSRRLKHSMKKLC